MTRRSALRAEPDAPSEPSHRDLSVGHLMGRARASLLAGLDAELAPFGLSGMQFAVLKHLADGAADNAAELCRLMRYDTGAMTRILDRLEQRRLLRRERGREDRRMVFLHLTAAGRSQLPRLLAVGARVLGAHLAGFTPAEIDALKSYLGRMIDNGKAQEDNRESFAAV
jgi:MarR family transcriptional regulator, multiple antibiotic resistance protein MarR